MPQTICHVIDYGGPTAGSFIPLLTSLSRAVVARGDRFVTIATEIAGSTWPDELRSAGAELHLVNGAEEVIAALHAVRPDIVHAHFTRYDAATLRGPKNARIFWHVHSHREDKSVAARLKAMLKYGVAALRVEALVAVSHVLGEELVAFGAPRRIVRVVENAIDVERFRPATEEERAAAREALGIARDEKAMLFFERVAYKGGATLRAALAELPDFRLIVAGGTKADRDAFGSAPRVIAIERAADARSLYWAADILAFASDGEAFGFVLAEALACDVPLAASDIPIVHEVCGDADQVGYFPVRDGAALARALRERAGLKSTNGRARMVARFGLDRWTAGVLHLYDRA